MISVTKLQYLHEFVKLLDTDASGSIPTGLAWGAFEAAVEDVEEYATDSDEGDADDSS